MGDNRLFNVNGIGSEMLVKALELSFMQESDRTHMCSGWMQTEEHGLILCWSNSREDVNSFPSDLSAQECLPIVEQWLLGDFAKTVKLARWCEDNDHDGHNKLGWQVYCEDWGHVNGRWETICAIRPAYIWYGK